MTVMPPSIRIVPSRIESLASINALIQDSKSYWPWPADYLLHALRLHLVDAKYLETHPSFEILDEVGDLVGFASLDTSGPRTLLDNLWIRPDRISRGVGRAACELLLRLARQRGWFELQVLPDPPSEGFYLKMGFTDTGARIPSRVPGGPVFSVYRISLGDVDGK